jgi:DNA-binding NarL/FixJ family response regulator
MAKVLIADDDPGSCETLADILAAQGYAVTTVEDGPAALAATLSERYDAIFVDQRMPALEGLAVVEELRKRDACDDVYVITAYADDHLVRQALARGARRVFVKPLDIPLLLEALSSASADRISPHTAAPAEAQADAGPSLQGLTRRELQVLTLLAQGKSNQEIADELVLSRRTVERHVSEIFTKLGVAARSAAAALAIRHRLI